MSKSASMLEKGLDQEVVFEHLVQPVQPENQTQVYYQPSSAS